MMGAPARWTRIVAWLAGAAGAVVLVLFVAFFVQSMLGPEAMWPHLRGLLLRWQTFIAGFLALIAGILTVSATWSAAKSEIEATRNQTEAMVRDERRRIAREAYAFFAMMDAALAGVLDDIERAREIRAITGGPMGAYQARTRVKKAGFPELRTACLRYGGQQVTPTFLRLDKAIDDFSSVPKEITAVSTGREAGLDEELDHIEVLAKSLRDEVGLGIKRCTAVLAEREAPDFP
jgi:hypothetical protein